MKENKKRGRPAKPKAERAVSVNFTMRMKPRLMDELRSSAETSGITISAEAERRLSQLYQPEAARIVGIAITNIEKNGDSNGDSSELIRERCRIAWDIIGNLLFGSRPDIEQLGTEIEKNINRKKREELGTFNALLGGSPRTYEELNSDLDRLQGLTNARDVALASFKDSKEKQV